MPPPSFASWLARMTVRPKLGKQVVQEIPAPGTANSADLWSEHCCDLCEKIDKRIIDNARPSDGAGGTSGGRGGRNRIRGDLIE